MSQALKAAIEANDPAAAKKALVSVKDLSRKLPKAEAPLQYACQLGADAVVEVLLEAGAPLKGKSEYEGNHLFSVAAEHGHPKVLEKLATRGVPQNVVSHALFHATLVGHEQVVRTILEHCKTVVPQRVLEVSTWWKDGRIFKTLLEHGVDVNTANDGSENYEQLGETALHDAAGSGHLDPIRLLLDQGANVNAQDAFGRTPLMHLAAAMPRLDQELRARRKAASRVLTKSQKELQAKINAQTRPYGDREPSDGLASASLLLERGAQATLTDRFGNDALMYYEWERRRDQEQPNGKFIALLEEAGARGLRSTADLFWALRADDVALARRAIQAGANVNQDAPPPVSSTPLVMARSPAMVRLLLQAGADPNKPSLTTTPLIAANSQIEIVKMLVEAGADIHAIEPRSPRSEYVANAYSAAEMNRKYDVAEYLKSLGAGKPVLKNWKPLKAGVGIWENFSEVLVKGTVHQVADALAKLTGGKVHENVYGKNLLPGKRAYAVLRPKGMAWCNVLQIAPPPGFFDTDTEFLRRLAKASGLQVLLAEYSDAAGAASIERFKPDGTSLKDEGWDLETLQELVTELGPKAPPSMKAQLAKMKQSEGEEPASENRLTLLAQAEKFTLAWGGLQVEPGRPVEIAFTNLPIEAFDATAWVSD